MPLPGIEVGDLGDKIGYPTVDNGWLSFDHYRIPRTNMLARFASITKEGDFELNANPKILYQIMVQTRLIICFGAAMLLHKAALFAIRYSVCRRQFSNIPKKKEERKIIDYQTQMDTLGTSLA